MPTVANLLSKPMFKDFRMVSGKSGLNNKVTSAGFLEWEQDTQITKSFDKGEFVLTTLASIKDDSVAIDRSLKLLINNHVSAIAIKDIYFTDLPDAIKDYSNEHGVPIMFFTDIYIDEILYAIKNETLNSLYTSFNEIVLDTLISNDNLDVLEKENLLRKINPFFYSATIMCAFISNRTDTSSISQDALDLYNNVLLDNGLDIPDSIEGADIIYSFVAYKRGIILIATINSTDSDIVDQFKTTLISAFSSNAALSDTHIGISRAITGVDDIGTMLIDAIFANTSGILDNRNIAEISTAPFDHIIFKDRYLLGPNLYYEEMLDKLSETSSQRSPLLETLITLVNCNGNVDIAAQKMFQHKNTIRYRMNKLKAVFAADNELEFYGKLYLFSRIHFSKEFLEPFFSNK
ncbi:MAG: PucR family transcriptional regulator [Firmicutes bacterium]|nr:PucR family transcriptional regulator [Bacillota bacterium]